MIVEEFIIALLRQNNCVIVPNFGGFIANTNSAIIDQSKQKIYPPSKTILFNPKLDNNDGLLANHIAQAKTISFPESISFIDETVQNWRKKLASENRISFGEIGYLFEQNGTVVFEQNREFNLLLSAYGLSGVQFIQKNTEAVIDQPIDLEDSPIEIVSLPQDQPSKVNRETPIIPIRTDQKSRKRWGYLAAACIIPALFYTYWIPMETNFLSTGNIQLSDFNPFNRECDKIYNTRLNQTNFEPIVIEEDFNDMIKTIPEHVKIYNYQFDEDLYIPVRLNTNNIEVVTSEKSSISYQKSASIQLIVGCFSIAENANTMVKQLGDIGYSSYIFDQKNGLYRVAAGGFNNTDEAHNAEANLKKRNYSTWLLRK